MSTIHPAAVEHLRKRWTRPDAYRFAPPGSPEARKPGHLHSWAAAARAEAAAAEAKADAALAADLEALRASHARVRNLLADVRFELALRRIFRKFDPDQPRVPAGSGRESGRWTDGGGEGETRQDQSDAVSNKPDDGPTASTNSDVQRILSRASQLNLAARSPDYRECLNLCYPLLERPLPRWSDRNTFDFHKCMNACLGRNL